MRPQLARFLQPLRALPQPRPARLQRLVTLNAAEAAEGRSVTGLTMTKQLEDNWCWAAVTQAVLNQRLSTRRSQEAIAIRHMQLTGRPACSAPHKEHRVGQGCTDDGCTGLCNDEHYLRVILTEQDCYRTLLTAYPDELQFEQVQSEVGANRPVACRLERNGPGHFVLISGWSVGTDGVPRVTVLDPASGVAGGLVPSHDMPFNDFLNRYPFAAGTGYVSHSYGVR